jgi:hypothetical protein
MKWTLDFDILYIKSKYPRLCGYTYSNWIGFLNDRKFTSGYVFNLGIGVVTLTNEKQHVVALSSTKEKY